MELWVASTNQGKLNEFRNLLEEAGIKIHSPSELPVYSSPPETGQTFLENARIKAKSLAALRSGLWVVADDSGLEVLGLNKMPGVHSARYAGPKASDRENNAKLLKMMQIRSPLQREAHFKCVFVVIDPHGKEHVIEGDVKGTISEKERGASGFGYDSVFIPEGQTQTFAELGPSFKNKVSHRALAIKKLKELLIGPV